MNRLLGSGGTIPINGAITEKDMAYPLWRSRYSGLAVIM